MKEIAAATATTVAAAVPNTSRVMHQLADVNATASKTMPATVKRTPHTRRAARAVRSATRWNTVGVSRQMIDPRALISANEVGAAPEVVEVGEALSERRREEEGHQHLYAREHDAQLLEQPV